MVFVLFLGRKYMRRKRRDNIYKSCLLRRPFVEHGRYSVIYNIDQWL